MDSPRLQMLSGAEIVDRGRNVTDTQLPEVGTKETTATGSWLEQKQVQAALEARKALVAVEKIDKVGCLSHAEWLDEQRLAEVTQQIGGYWQYLGHNVNGTLYLLPEEALYLMETNCLLLKHNNVTVSLQKAYSLLLDDKMSLTQYKVYASLSRVGYKVFRHDRLKISPRKGNESNTSDAMEVSSNIDETISDFHMASKASPKNPDFNSKSMAVDTNILTEDKVITDNKGIKPLLAMATDAVMNLVMQTDNEITETAQSSTMPLELPKSNVMDLSEPKDLPSGVTYEISAVSSDKPISPSDSIFSVDENGVVRLGLENTDIAMETNPSPATDDEIKNENKMETDDDVNENTKPSNKNVRLNIYIVKKSKIQNRNVRSSDPKSVHDKFKDIPDFYKKQVVTVNVPCEDYLPRNVFLNNTSYVVDTNNISKKRESRCPTPIRTAGNRSMYKTIRNSIESENAAVPTPETSQFVPNTPSYERPYGYFHHWRPHIQRPYHQQLRFNQQPRFNQHPYFYRVMNTMPQNVAYVPRPPFNLNHLQQQKVKDDHLDAIRTLARSLNHVSPNNYYNLKLSINGLISRFNKIYSEKFIITPEHHIINSRERIETIEIQDDEAGLGHKQRKVNKFDQYLGNIKMLAARLKNLARKKQPIAKQKRAFSKLVKRFNKEYDAELYLDDNGELADRKLVVLDSSDSDVAAVDEIETTNRKKRKSRDGNDTTNKKRKILANPFSVIAKLNGSTSQNASEIPQTTSKGIENYFDKNWLPGDDDFGKALPCSVTDAQHLLYDTPQLYDFMEDPASFKTWIDLKLTFYTHMEAIFSFEQDLTESRNLTNHSGVKPILQGAVTEDWASSEKIRIIKTNTDIEETNLCVHFDVYNRDVQNFRKTDPPTPHFRIVCVKESSEFPSIVEVRGLHSKYEDNVNITFAVVGIASISYLQIKPVNLPSVEGNDF